MIRPIDTMRRWWRTGPPRVTATEEQELQQTASPAAASPPEPPWLAQLDRAGVPRTLTYPTTSLGRILDQTTGRFGEAVALVYENKQWTYRELLAAVNRTAGGLASLGVRRGDRVLIVLP